MPSDQYVGVENQRSTSPDAPFYGHLRSRTKTSVIPPGTVPRQRLVDRMSLGVQRPLTLVCAPAGFGKTMLLKSWAGQYQGPAVVRRIALDAASEDPPAMVESVREGLSRRDRNVQVLLVDCGDLTVTPKFGRSLQRLIRGNAGRVRIVLATRSDPPLPLHLYRLAGTIAEIRAADLAFTIDETTALMREHKLELTISEVAELQARTDGWPAALMFAAMNLTGKADADQVIRDFRGDSGNLAAYLMTEVLDAQPPEMREFLLRTCIVDEVRPELAALLTGQASAGRSLQFLSHGNSFIQPVPGTADCYSYQALFREFLRAQLMFESPTLVPALHRDAAAWFAQNGQPLHAIHHAVAAGDWQHAARYLVEDFEVAGLLVGRRRQQLTTLFAGFPDDLDGSEAAIINAARALAEFDVDRCTSQLGKAAVRLDRQTSARRQPAESAIRVLQAVCASLSENPESGLVPVLIAEADLRATSPESAVAHPEPRLLVAGSKGRVLLQRGDFPAALGAFTEGIALAEENGAQDALVDFLGMAALVEAAWGHLRRAGEVVAHATSVAESGAQLPQSAIVAGAWVHTDRSELPSAEEMVQRAEEAAPTHDTRVLAAALALVRARLLRATGKIDRAAAELRAARDSYGAQGGWLGEALTIDEAKTLVAQHRPREAITTIEQSAGRDNVGSRLVLQRAAAEAGDPPSPQPLPATDRGVALEIQVDGWLVQAAESIRTGDTGRSGLCLERALRLAAPEQLRRPFAEAPPALRPLLRPSGDLMTHHPWLRTPGLRGRDRTASRWGVTPRELVITAALTSKEHEVLEYLAELLTTEEIAETMYVSVNTVRSHVRSILRKLSASRRNEAVRRAWELGLLPSRPEA
ncbi:LuxR family maltose regulon positive regulatory protein [Kribbella rubisoli]|uniref:LuxR family maltose regulon positive regulatory protein n=1 Tax=Kribbella rubisoli TaxID=3075929 RepID=A0A4Q7WNG2_9ACTN|nr:LuxR C-terminal-related transcriptional regulator [Kribbella rubisoli]RZU11263.1 LuxR family maltose regulon positive regulatory protein [Kribbella rubisoli]